MESSQDKAATIRKLSFGLADQLRFLKNRGLDVNKISGFYVPVTSGFVEMVECKWSDEDLTFSITSIPLKKEEVLTKIKDVYQIQVLHRPSVVGFTNFKVPLTPFVRAKWDRDAYQWNDGDSIVIIYPSDNSVYKHPMRARESFWLAYLRRMNIN